MKQCDKSLDKSNFALRRVKTRKISDEVNIFRERATDHLLDHSLGDDESNNTTFSFIQSNPSNKPSNIMQIRNRSASKKLYIRNKDYMTAVCGQSSY